MITAALNYQMSSINIFLFFLREFENLYVYKFTRQKGVCVLLSFVSFSKKERRNPFFYFIFFFFSSFFS